MTQDEIIRMALEAGCDNYGDCYEFVPEALERFAALVAAYEREKQAEQEPVAWIKLNEDGVYIEDVTGFPVYAAPVQQAEQEPVAWRCRYCNTDMPTEHASDCPVEVFGLNTASQHVKQEPVCKRCNGTKIVPDGKMYSVDGFQLEVPIECVKDCPDCAAPVRTKDLTDDEIFKCLADCDCLQSLKFARAVIAADREKNK